MSEGGGSKTLLLGFFNELHSILDGIRDLQAEARDVCKEAKSAGFDATKLREVEGWVHKVEKHGRDKMDDAEAIFDLYRSVVDAPTGKFEDMMSEERDKALLKLFAPDDQVEPKLSAATRKMRGALALAKAEKAART